ncbi:TetR/AcrR family transcriptional regulator [Plastorhodobacter daqingensis]|uniref:TetR/AcrR family transcriptional regulator n=1 Tax=Plastorhodobacter daqingensis TaxID=1387281 RepID=A0ABW2UK06_9RHOB
MTLQKPSPAPQVTARRRRTQAERSAEMREKACIATLQALTEVGYERISTKLIADRAKVSRGALTHHFPMRNDLLVAAFEYLVNSWERNWPFTAEPALPRLSIEELIDALWERLFSTEHYMAAMELMLAARMDSDLGQRLREVQLRWSGIRDTIAARILGVATEDDKNHLFLQLNLCLLRGIAVHKSFDNDPAVDLKLLTLWKDIVREQRVIHLPGAGRAEDVPSA